MAATLKRSTISFRRQGSSGLAWEENWIPAEIDGKLSHASAPGRDGNSSSTTISSSASNFPQLRHSRSVGSAATRAAYTRTRDHRVQGAGAAGDLKSAAQAPGSAPGHKSNHRILRWIKRTFSKFAG